jgi:hypothetical protein
VWGKLTLPTERKSCWPRLAKSSVRGTAGGFLFRLRRAFRPQRRAEGHHRQAQCGAVEALADPAVQSRLAHLGMGVVSREEQTLEALSGPVKADAEKWWSIIKELRTKAVNRTGHAAQKVVGPTLATWRLTE